MRGVILALATALLPAAAVAGPGDDPARFDGAWTATVTCPNASGALGYAFDVPSQVKAGVYHGERLGAGEPGWLTLDGRIETDGKAMLHAKGLVGASPMAVGQRPRGTDYGYDVAAQFDGSHGSGSRVEGRRCDLTFVRK